jgi:hypothetical protein
LDVIIQHLAEVEAVSHASNMNAKADPSYTKDPGWTVTATFLEWLRTIIVKKWDGKATVHKQSSVGVSILTFDKLCKWYRQSVAHFD